MAPELKQVGTTIEHKINPSESELLELDESRVFPSWRVSHNIRFKNVIGKAVRSLDISEKELMRRLEQGEVIYYE